MADNFLERRREEYELKKKYYLTGKKYPKKKLHRKLEEPEDEAL